MREALALVRSPVVADGEEAKVLPVILVIGGIGLAVILCLLMPVFLMLIRMGRRSV